MHRLQYVGLLLAALCGGFLSNFVLSGRASAEPPGPAGRAVDTDELVIRDKDGNVRMKFAVDKSGDPAFVMYDRRGRKRASFAIASEGRKDDGVAQLNLLGADEKAGVYLYTEPKHSAGLRVYDPAGTERGGLRVEPNNSSLLLLHGPAGEERLRLEADQEGTARYELKNARAGSVLTETVSGDGEYKAQVLDAAGKPRIITHFDKDKLAYFQTRRADGAIGTETGIARSDMPFLNIYDPAGKFRGGLSLNKENWTLLSLADKDGKNRLYAFVNPEGNPAFQTADVNNKVTWQGGK